MVIWYFQSSSPSIAAKPEGSNRLIKGEPMKVKKVVKKLRRAQNLLSTVVDQYAGSKSVISDLIDAASVSIKRAETLVAGRRSLVLGRKPAVRRMTEEGRKRLSLAAKKRWAKAKRKGLRTLAALR
jgi:prophage DNA circulation protein